MKDDFKKIEGYKATINPCPFCGSPAEMWECEVNDDLFKKVVMCSNGGINIEADDEECPMYMSNSAFYKDTKLDALNTWNKRAT